MGSDSSLKKKGGHRKGGVFCFFFENERDLNIHVGRAVRCSRKSGDVRIRDLNLHSGPVTMSVDKSLNLCTSTYTHIK